MRRGRPNEATLGLQLFLFFFEKYLVDWYAYINFQSHSPDSLHRHPRRADGDARASVGAETCLFASKLTTSKQWLLQHLARFSLHEARTVDGGIDWTLILFWCTILMFILEPPDWITLLLFSSFSAIQRDFDLNRLEHEQSASGWERRNEKSGGWAMKVLWVRICMDDVCWHKVVIYFAFERWREWKQSHYARL